MNDSAERPDPEGRAVPCDLGMAHVHRILRNSTCTTPSPSTMFPYQRDDEPDRPEMTTDVFSAGILFHFHRALANRYSSSRPSSQIEVSIPRVSSSSCRMKAGNALGHAHACVHHGNLFAAAYVSVWCFRACRRCKCRRIEGDHRRW
jgi:hypothetical protein